MNANSDERSPVSATPALTGIVSMIDRLLRIVDVAGKFVVAVSILMTLVFIFGQVLDRHLLKGAFNAYEQMAQLSLIWLAFVGIAMAFRERSNIVVDVIDGLLPARVVAVKALLLDVLSLGPMYFLLIYGMRMLQVGAYQPVMGTPFTYQLVYLGMVIGCMMLTLFLVVRIVTGAIRIARHETAIPTAATDITGAGA